MVLGHVPKCYGFVCTSHTQFTVICQTTNNIQVTNFYFDVKVVNCYFSLISWRWVHRMGREGIEPSADGLKARCSTAELTTRLWCFLLIEGFENLAGSHLHLTLGFDIRQDIPVPSIRGSRTGRNPSLSSL